METLNSYFIKTYSGCGVLRENLREFSGSFVREFYVLLLLLLLLLFREREGEGTLMLLVVEETAGVGSSWVILYGAEKLRCRYPQRKLQKKGRRREKKEAARIKFNNERAYPSALGSFGWFPVSKEGKYYRRTYPYAPFGTKPPCPGRSMLPQNFSFRQIRFLFIHTFQKHFFHKF